MSDSAPKGPLPTWSVPLLAAYLRECLPNLNLAATLLELEPPPMAWLLADAGTRSRRRRKATRNADAAKRGDTCRRCGATERIELHHVAPLYVSAEIGPWREIERETVDLCVTCHNLFEEALDRVLPVTNICHRWTAEQFRQHPEWLTLGERG